MAKRTTDRVDGVAPFRSGVARHWRRCRASARLLRCVNSVLSVVKSFPFVRGLVALHAPSDFAS